MNNPDSFLARIYKLVIVGPSIYSRIFYFAMGGPLSSGINYTIMCIAQYRMGLAREVALGISFTATAVIFAVWNYFINFRTSQDWGKCLPRYVAALGFCTALNYLITLTGMKQLAHGSKLLDFAVLVTSTLIMSGPKFLLYHFWVYPHTPSEPIPQVKAKC